MAASTPGCARHSPSSSDQWPIPCSAAKHLGVGLNAPGQRDDVHAVDAVDGGQVAPGDGALAGQHHPHDGSS